MPYKLYIGNLPYTVSAQDLEKLFSSCGTVVNVHIPINKDTGRPRGFAFVELSLQEELLEAVYKFNGTDVGGRNIKVMQALEKVDKSDYTPTRKSYAKELGTGECILCHTVDTIYGLESGESYSSGVCSSCITSLSKAIQPPSITHRVGRQQKSQY